jgi:hypothetical protein
VGSGKKALPKGLVIVAIKYIVGYTTVAIKNQPLELWSHSIQLSTSIASDLKVG